jgi:CheY-like chemotaxis protein
MTEGMVTYQDNAIPAETIPKRDTLFAYRADRMPQLGIQTGKRPDLMRADPRRRVTLVLALEDTRTMSDAMLEICDFLDISLERIDSYEDLLPFLQRWQPMAVVAAMDADGQDGCHVLMTVARHDPALPVLLMTGHDPAVAGAVDAVTELWGLTEVIQTAAWPPPGIIAEFLCRAGLRGNCLAFLPV